MDFYALSPPNAAALSDNIIGTVVQRTRARSIKEHVQERPLYKQEPQRHTYRQALHNRAKAQPPTSFPEKNSHTRNHVPPTQKAMTSVLALIEQTSSGRNRRSVRRSDLETANRILSAIQTAKHPITAELQAAVVADALKKKIQHRERCRVNQARYRQRQDKIKNDIRDQIAALEAEIKELELRGQDSSGLPTMPTIWALAAEYVRHFRQFLSSPVALQAASASFLRGILAPDAVDTSALGEQAQIENWKLFALYFDDAELELKGMDMPTSDTLVAGTSTTISITRNTLRYAFPHLNSDGMGGTQGGAWSSLAARMIGQKLVMRGSVTFSLDHSSGKLVRLQTRADMLSPMLKLLGNLEDVFCVFDKATVTPECQFVRKD